MDSTDVDARLYRIKLKLMELMDELSELQRDLRDDNA